MNDGKRLAAGAVLGGAALAVLLLWVSAGPPSIEPQVHLLVQPSAPGEAPAAAVPTGASQGGQPHAPDGAWRDPLAGRPDLKRAFEKLVNGESVSERAAAWRAWSACMPAFLGSSQQAASPQQLGAAFAPGPERPQRLEALRELHARCQGFLRDTHDALAADAQRIGRLHAAGQLRSRAETARSLLAMGDRAGALQGIARALAARDPAEIRELSGLVELLHADAGEAAPADRVRDAALAVAACDLGLDCSPGSTLALQLCAMHARCDGDAAERTLAAFADLDRAAVDAERRRLVDLLHAGRFDGRAYFGSP